MHETPNGILIPEPIETKQFHDANDAWEHVNAIYTSSITFLRSKFQAVLSHQSGHQRYRAFSLKSGLQRQRMIKLIAD